MNTPGDFTREPGRVGPVARCYRALRDRTDTVRLSNT
jgi:hypothetical protein